MKLRILLIILLLFVFVISKAISNTLNSSEREHYFKLKDSFSTLNIEYSGKIIIASDDKEIESISPDGYLRITKSSFGNSRKIEIESDSKGNLTKKFFNGKKEVAFSPAGQDWLDDILLDVIRKTGIGGRDRIVRIYDSGGINSVFKELEYYDNVPSYSYYKGTIYNRSFQYIGFNVKYLCYKILVNDIELNKEEIIKVLKALQDISSNSTKGTLLREILSNYEFDTYLKVKFLETTKTLSYNTERGNVLRAFQKKYKITEDIADEYFDIINEMSINSEKGNVIKPLLETQILSVKVLSKVITEVDKFTNPSEKAAIYRLLLTHVSENQKLKDQLIYATKQLSNSYYFLKEEILVSLGQNILIIDKTKSKSVITDLLEISETYNYNTQKTVLLRSLHGSLTNDYDVLDSYFDVIGTMNNQMEVYNIILDLIRIHKLNTYGYHRVLEICKDLAKDDYKHGASSILRAVLNDLPKDTDVLEAFFNVLEIIDHNSAKEEVIRMMCEKGKLDNKLIVYLLKTAEDIDVDIEKATALQNIKRVMKNDTDLDYIFYSVANEIISDYEFERAIR